MKAMLALLVLCLNVCPLGAEEQSSDKPEVSKLQTLDGRIYQEIRSLKVMPNKIRIIHRDGAVTVRYDALDEETRRKFGYDPEKAAAADRDDAEKARSQAAALRAEEEVFSATQAGDARKAAAIDVLKKKNFGGHYYWHSQSWDRDARDHEARRILVRAGCSESEAALIVKRLKEEGRNAPAPKRDPAFTQPQGQLRGVPNGTTRKRR